MNKRGQVFNQLGALATGVAVLAITLTVAFLVMSQGKDQIGTLESVDPATCVTLGDASNGTPSFACNGTSTLQDAVQDIPGWVPLVIIGAIGAILLSLVALFQRSA